MMPDRETVITHLQIIHTWASFARERDLQFFTPKHLEDIEQWSDDALALLKEQQEQIEQMNFIYGFVYGGQVKEIKKLVRCNECRHRDPEDHKCDCGHDIQWQLPRADDWFCADGEEK